MLVDAATLRDRAQRKTLKRQEKKDAIALSAIEALKTLGYANTTLRDIAANSDLSLGMLHYYFDDKTQLVVHCVTVYKQRFIRDIEAAIADADTDAAFVTALSDGLATAITEDWARHRLWYDIRGQAMFNPDFRPVVDDIEAGLIRVLGGAGRFGAGLGAAMGFAALDGMFRYHTQRWASGDGRPRAEIAAGFADMLMRLAR